MFANPVDFFICHKETSLRQEDLDVQTINRAEVFAIGGQDGEVEFKRGRGNQCIA
jgi:hypothetical protein